MKHRAMVILNGSKLFMTIIIVLMVYIFFFGFSLVDAQSISSPDFELLKEEINKDFLEAPKIVQIKIEDQYAFGALLVSLGGNLQEGEGKLFVSIWNSDKWIVYYEGSKEFLDTIDELPDSLIPQNFKEFILEENLLSTNQITDNQRVTGYKLPWSCGVERYVRNDWDKHPVVSSGIALDVDMPHNGVITAAASGTVHSIQENHNECGCDYSLRPLGNYIIIHNDQGYYDTYVHIKQWGAIPEEGDYVYQGEPIAYAYKTGYTCGSRATCDSGTCYVSNCNVYVHLHFHVEDKYGNRLRPVFDDVGEVEVGYYTSGNCGDSVPPTNPTSINPGCTAGSGVWQNTCNNPNFSWSGASDSGSGVAGYQYYWGTSSTGTSSNYTSNTSYDPPAVGDGTYYFRIRTEDNMGNYASWKTMFILKYDGTAPINPGIIGSGCPVQDAVWQNVCSDLDFSWSGASDLSSGLAGYQHYWGPSSSGTSTSYTSTSNFNPIAVLDGEYYFRIRTKDNAGNYSSWKTMFLLRYDGTPPIGSIKINKDDSITNRTFVELNSEANDNLSGAVSIRFRDQGNIWTDWKDVFTTSWLLPAVTGQIHIIEAQILDDAGNTSPVYHDEIYLDIYPDQPSSEGFILIKSTFGMSGTNASTSLYQLHGTLSQPSTIGLSTSENYTVASGYWSWLYDVMVEIFNFLPLISR